MDNRGFEFVPDVFFKVLAATLAFILLGWVGTVWLHGSLATRDIVGSLICAPIFSYMVHLWIVYARDQEPGDGEE